MEWWFSSATTLKARLGFVFLTRALKPGRTGAASLLDSVMDLKGICLSYHKIIGI